MIEEKTAQLRAKPNVISGYGPGVFWETPSRARMLIDTGQFILVNAAVIPQPAAGPTETKPAGPLEKKSFAAGQAGRSTDSASSSEPGTAAPLPSSAEGQASPDSKSQPSPPNESADRSL